MAVKDFTVCFKTLTSIQMNPNKYASIHYEKIQVSVSEFDDKWRVICPVDELDQVENGENLMDVDVFGLVDSKMVEVVLKMDAVVCLQAK